jgi:hypothetical protein
MQVSVINITLDDIEILGITRFSCINKETGTIEQFKLEKGAYYFWYSNNDSWREIHEDTMSGLIDTNSLFTVHCEEV